MVKVALLGASGNVGQPLALLLKQSPCVTELALYSRKDTPGIAADLSHVPSLARVQAHLPNGHGGGLPGALKGAAVVVICASAPYKLGMDRHDLFNLNASIMAELTEAIALYAPQDTLIAVVSNPVNSLVPIVADVLAACGRYDPTRLFGVTTLDLFRAETFVSTEMGHPELATRVKVPVVGGHSGDTIVPLVSLCEPGLPPLPAAEADERHRKLIHRIKTAGMEVVQAKAAAAGGAATLSMAAAAARLILALIQARAASPSSPFTEEGYAMVDLSSDPAGGDALRQKLFSHLPSDTRGKVRFCAAPILIHSGDGNIKSILPVPDVQSLPPIEQEALAHAAPKLVQDIHVGSQWVASSYAPSLTSSTAPRPTPTPAPARDTHPDPAAPIAV